MTGATKDDAFGRLWDRLYHNALDEKDNVWFHDIVHPAARPDRSADVIHVEARGGAETSCPAGHEP